MTDYIEKLERWYKLKEQGILTQEEFDQKKQHLLKQSISNKQTTPTANNETSLALLEGVEIGAMGRKFRLVKQIGSGGMGEVWQARDLAEEAISEEQPIYKALKVVNAHMMHSPGAIKKLQKEAIQVAKLTHPNIINVNNWHQGVEGWLFIEMEFLQGRDLEDYLSDYDDGLSWEQSIPILQAIAKGLSYAHTEHKLIHRDLKPGNIFITQQQQIKILDFGLAYRLRKSSISNMQQADTSGVAEYMPPEAFLAGKPDVRHDVYAFACLIYEMLTGEPPYSREKSVNRGVDEWPPKPEKLTEPAWQILKQGLAYKKEKRVQGIKLLIDQIHDAMILSNENNVLVVGKKIIQEGSYISSNITQLEDDDTQIKLKEKLISLEAIEQLREKKAMVELELIEASGREELEKISKRIEDLSFMITSLKMNKLNKIEYEKEVEKVLESANRILKAGEKMEDFPSSSKRWKFW